jgi:hypothetical protein
MNGPQMKLAMVRCFNLVRDLVGHDGWSAFQRPPAVTIRGPGVRFSRGACDLPEQANCETDKQHQEIDIAVYDSLDELVKHGDAMLERFRNNETPLPTENEFQQWDKRLIALAESCATIEERNKPREGNPIHVTTEDIMSIYVTVGRWFAGMADNEITTLIRLFLLNRADEINAWACARAAYEN